MDNFGSAFKGPPNMGHVSEEFFKTYFIGTNVALTMLLYPGRVLGTEVRPRKYARDHIIAITDENAQKREALRGKRVPRSFMFKPRVKKPKSAGVQEDGSAKPVASWEEMFHQHLHWKRWTLERTGPVYPSA